MKQLEILDFSMNQLTGIIPQDVASLISVSNMNLSDNDFSSRILTSTQLQSLSPYDFLGKQNLYGPPLMATCPRDNTSSERVPSIGDEGDKDGG